MTVGGAVSSMNGDMAIIREWAEAKVSGRHFATDCDLKVARHILNTTTPPTMADVDWDNDVHTGLCAMYANGDLVRMIGPDLDNKDGIICHWVHYDSPVAGGLLAEHLTPLPGTRLDLTPRRTHADTVTAASIEDYKSGRVVDFDDKTLLPRPEDVPVGEVWEVEAVGYGKWAGTRSNPGNTNSPWTLIRVDSCDYYWAKDDQVTPVRRLVPDTTPDHPTELTTAAEYLHAPAGTVVAADTEEAWTKGKDGYWETYGVISGYTNYGIADGSRRVLRWGWFA